jgi:hypothetical protein
VCLSTFVFVGSGHVGVSMLLGIYWFVVKDSRRKAAINVLFLCEMDVGVHI